MSERWDVVGRVLPERASVDLPRLSLDIRQGEHSHRAELQVQMGHAHVRIEASAPLSLFEAIDVFRHSIAPLANFISVQYRGAYTIQADTAVDDQGQQHACPIFEPIFEPVPPGYTFSSPENARWGQVPIPIQTIGEFSVRGALHSLTQATRFSDFTFMYCRLAIESVRAHYDPSAKRGTAWAEIERAGEREMCSKLRIKRESLKQFQSKAARTRHGKQVLEGGWEDRKNALQLSWEIVHRHIRYLSVGADLDWEEI